MSFQVSPQHALENAGRMMKEGGFESVKLEGGEEVAEHVRAHRRRGHPGDGPRRPHAAVGARDGRLQGAGQGRRRRRARARTTRARSRTPAPTRSCSRRSRPISPRRSPPRVSVPTIGIGAGAGLRRPGARLLRPARHVPRDSSPSSRSASPRSASRSSTRRAPTSARCRRARSPRAEHTFKPNGPRRRPSPPPPAPLPSPSPEFPPADEIPPHWQTH